MSLDLAHVTLSVCKLLDELGVGVFKESSPYAASDVAITIKRLPATPDKAVAVNAYAVSDPRFGLSNYTVMVQLRFRAPGPLTAVDVFADQAATVLHGTHSVQVNGLHISRIRRVSVAPLGTDSNRREERADNYELIIPAP